MRYNLSTLGLALLSILLLSSCARPDPPNINFYRAIHAGDLDQIKRHIYHGTDINKPDRDGEMPLHVAVRKGRLVITRLLVENGADIEARNHLGRTPLETAVLSGKVPVARLLLERGATIEPQQLLLSAIDADANFRDVFEFLTANGADINKSSEDGETPLIRAVGTGYRLVVKRLLDQGADVNHKQADGRTALAYAQQLGNDDIVRLLKRYGGV